MILVVICLDLVLSSSELPTMEQIAGEYHQSRSVLQAFEFDWTGTRTLMNGDERDRLPKDPVTLSERGTIKSRGQDCRSESIADRWNLSKKSIVQRPIDAVFFDGVRKTFDKTLHAGNIGKDTVIAPSGADLLIQALCAQPRVLVSPKISVLRYEESPSGQLIVVGNTNWKENSSNTFTYRVETFLDSGKNYSPVRIVSYDEAGELVYEVQYEYVEDALLGFVPKTVVATKWGRDVTGELLIKEVVETKLLSLRKNVDLPESTFELEFPEGTQVTDEIAKVEYKVGALLPISGEERWVDLITNSSDRELLQSEIDDQSVTDKALPGSGTNRPRALVVYILAGVALLLVAIILRTRNKHKQS